ncbi:hypothetical protein O6H91_08G108500 [Diphasiastrum complanatum]|nr:hypothetical protein O6H91_08G108500 [Diphasiastrum complanatum]
MSGKSKGIRIHAVFVSKETGEVLLKYAGDVSIKCYILPVFESATWSIMAVSFISLLAVTAVLSTFFFVRRHRLQGLGSRVLFSRSPLSMSFRAVKALPSLLFRLGVSDTVTYETCAICLEDYETGDKLRILPCHHEFHATCIDRWLLLRQSFCPKCKRDVRVDAEAIVASESTPLLAAVPRLPFTIVSSRHIPIRITNTGSIGRASSGALSISATTQMPSVGSFASPSHSLASSYSSSVVVPVSLSTHSFHSHSAYSVSWSHQNGSLMSYARSYSSS